MCDATEEILAVVAQLRQESETWRAVAEQYKAAFEGQTARLKELQDICVASQAELENERTEHRRRQARSGSNHSGVDLFTHDGPKDLDDFSCGTANIQLPSYTAPLWEDFLQLTSPCLRRIEHLASQRDYGTALKEVEHLLRGSLTPETRVEGLLVKSNLMRKSEWLYDALATCSEALEICGHLEELHSFLPRLQYQRGLCYYQLNMMQQARDALNEIPIVDGPLDTKASALRLSCEERLQVGRRAAFEAHRSFTEDILSSSSENRFDSKRRRTSSQLRLHATAKRFSLPHRWSSSRSRSGFN